MNFSQIHIEIPTNLPGLDHFIFQQISKNADNYHMSAGNPNIKVMDLFGSNQWWNRWIQLNLPDDSWELKSRWGFSYSKQSFSELFDYENSPSDLVLDEAKKSGAHFYVANKVFNPELKHSRWSAVSHPATYILPLNELDRIRPSTIESVAVAKRRLQRRVGSLEFKRISSVSETENWIQQWTKNLSARFPDAPLLQSPYDHVVRQWLSGSPLPDWIRLYQLNSGELNLATCWAYLHQGTLALYSPMMNPDPKIAQMAPGKVMIDFIIEEAKSLGCHQVDFLRGDHQYKLDWGSYKVPLYTVYVPLTRTGLLLVESIKLRQRQVG